ncbi:MAG: RtcB family protein [Desulfobacteraceae bacterium]|nr:RtcB family protein [Desulfobacteraceae bacterium]MDH3838942.1 RtcB family protein [Desulfobacteraceae bacterium]MDH3875997.1 RtcB family protein [Desulfobacteraceae bacterium]
MNRELEDKGIYVIWTGRSILAEEIQEAYKDVSQVVEVMHEAGTLKKVARIRPSWWARVSLQFFMGDRY